MSSRRLVVRVGPVQVLGQAILRGHEHSFSKLGADGTGKGNVAPAPGGVVFGVAYRLRAGQLSTLAEIEGGYRSLELEVEVGGQLLAATTFVALRPGPTPPPTAEYIAHYRAGMTEHGIGEDYAAKIFAALAGRVL